MSVIYMYILWHVVHDAYIHYIATAIDLKKAIFTFIKVLQGIAISMHACMLT